MAEDIYDVQLNPVELDEQSLVMEIGRRFTMSKDVAQELGFETVKEYFEGHLKENRESSLIVPVGEGLTYMLADHQEWARPLVESLRTNGELVYIGPGILHQSTGTHCYDLMIPEESVLEIVAQNERKSAEESLNGRKPSKEQIGIKGLYESAEEYLPGLNPHQNYIDYLEKELTKDFSQMELLKWFIFSYHAHQSFKLF